MADGPWSGGEGDGVGPGWESLRVSEKDIASRLQKGHAVREDQLASHLCVFQ